jgi:hypothetical protein
MRVRGWGWAVVLACVGFGCGPSPQPAEPIMLEAEPSRGTRVESLPGRLWEGTWVVTATTALPEPSEVTEFPRPCPDLYADGLLPTFELEISEQVWARLEQAFAAIQAKSPEPDEWHPFTFRHGAEVIPDAMIRVRGSSTSCGGMQFAIAFNKVNEKGRFRGLRRLNFDHGGCRLMQERLAWSFVRDLGLPAACANHARLVVNGEYYGLFLNLEHMNKDFLRRNFARYQGNLYKYGKLLKTNEEAPEPSLIEAYWSARQLARVEELVDLPHALAVWAAEAVMPARDNFWLWSWNYYLYEHPTRGFLYLHNDLDQTFPPTEADSGVDTLLPARLQFPADLVLADPVWRERYLDEVDRAIAAFDLELFEARLDGWWEEVREAAQSNPYRAFSEGHVRRFKDQLRARRQWLERWQRPPLQ